jgi:deoxyribodipyrimidine photo-lyase
MDTALVLFTRDLRVHDQPALAAAARQARRVVPLFVLDDAILGSAYAAPNRLGFLLESLRDLDVSLRRLGGRLHVRRGDPAAEAHAVARETGAEAVFVSEDASAHAQSREAALAALLELRREPGVTAVPFGDALTADGRPYRVFTPYWRRWQGTPVRGLEDPPRLVAPELDPRLELLDGVRVGARSPDVARGGETAARAVLERWLADGLPRYGQDRGGTELAHERTSRLSPYLHFGCVSPLECIVRARDVAGSEPWIRELCWRDFYAQLLHAHPETSTEDLHDRDYGRGGDGPELEAWRAGRTGYPLVDAGMRQLLREGWMHNRVRLVTASFLVKDLGIDWRHGARHFEDLLLDGDVASNRGNWQWVAGTGVDHTQGGRIFNPTLQAKRRDASGEYVRRYVPELAHLDAPAVHEPWTVGGADGYPEPIVDHAEVVRRRRSQARLF